MDTPDAPVPPPTDAEIASLIAEALDPDAHASAATKAAAFYREIVSLSVPRIAVLLAYQQIMLEALTAELSKLNAKEKSRIVLPNGMKRLRRL